MNSAGTLLLIWTVLRFQDSAAQTAEEQGNSSKSCSPEDTFTIRSCLGNFTCRFIKWDPQAFNIDCSTGNITTCSECSCSSNSSVLEGLQKVWDFLKMPEVLAAFFTGVLLSALVCVCDRRCCRRQKKCRRKFEKSPSENGEVTTAHVLSMVDRRQAEPREVEYSAIDFSSWNRKPPTDRKNEPQATETEYAELQKEGCREETAEGLGDVEEEVEVRTEAQVVEETAMVVEVEQREEVAAVGGEDEV